MWGKRSREGNLSLESFTPVYLNFILSTANGPYSFGWSCWSLLVPDDAKGRSAEIISRLENIVG
jgi:hypothetical protein